MRWEILDETRKEILFKIVKNIDLKDYYLAGGTALSLQMGLRESFDFDFFVPHEFNTDDLLEQLRRIYPQLLVKKQDNKTLDFMICIKSARKQDFQLKPCILF